MEHAAIISFLKGQIKKHGTSFSVALKYRTENGKVRKRSGAFIDLIGEEELILFNPEKGTQGKYRVERIEEIKKRTA